MAKRSRWLVLSFVVGLGVAVGVAAIWALGYPDRPRAGEGREVAIEIEPGLSLGQVADRLADAGVIDHPALFRLYAHRRGVATDLRSGAYTLRDDLEPREVLRVLVEGVREDTTRVTIPEGHHLLEVFDAVEGAGVAPRGELEALAFDDDFLDAREIDGHSAEGYLFPDTYEFRVPTPAEDVLDRMIDRRARVWRDVRESNAEAYYDIREDVGLSDHDLVILASIVEKEAAAAEERPRVAQVFLNRLTSSRFRPRLLQTDPTIRYGCMVPKGGRPEGCRGWSSTDRLRRRQLDDADNPFNTYQHEGLPPGPIANPGRSALEAVVSPDGSDYLYFVSRNDGTHVFSRTHDEHVRAVNRYQRGGGR